MSTWKQKILRGGPHSRNQPETCGTCGQPINKGDAKLTTLWMRGSEGCTTRRHDSCDHDQEPTAAELVEHQRRQALKRSA